jgi:tetraacyldisaccharide 4'-kinase
VVVFCKYLLKKPQDMGIKVIGVGNLVVGGSGKTPLVSAIAKEFQNPAIVLRGYGRDSKGLIVVQHQNKLLCDVKKCGDEALVYATKLQNATIIVSEDRKEGISKAKELGASFVILDDAYSKHDIKKLDILIDVKTINNFCLPSGPYREKVWLGKKVYKVYEDKDFKRDVTIKNPTKKMVLLTAIAKPDRLDPFLPKEVVAKHCFADHHNFTKEELDEIFQKEQPTSFLVTLKDYVKVKDFGYEFSLLDLDIHLEAQLYTEIKKYLS